MQHHHTSKFKKVSKKYLVNFIIFQFSTLVICLFSSILMLKVLKENLAESVFSAARHSILIGDLRQGMIFLDEAAKKYDFDISLVESDGKVIFSSLAPLSMKNSQPAVNYAFLQNIAFFPLHNSISMATGLGTKIVFEYSLFHNIKLAFFSFLGIMLLSLPFFARQKKRLLANYQQAVNFETTLAIARTTQGLAHDIRRPFSMLKMAFDAFENARTPMEAQANVREVLPDVERAMASVEGMLQDLMQIGADSKPNQEEASAQSIVASVMTDVFRIFPDGDFKVDYQFDHCSSVFIDTIRVGRVFTNILVNAAQAMNGKGKIWIRTQEQGEFVKFCIGNEGSYIPQEHLPKLFDSFFTHGKKGGTGLGLAIAHKVVTEHGGKICCESSKTKEHPAGFVQFIFTLPKGKQPASVFSEPLFNSSKDFQDYLKKLRETLSAVGLHEDIPAYNETEKKVENQLSKITGEWPTILIVEDEPAYRNMIQRLFEQQGSLVSKIPLKFAKNSAEAYAFLEEKNPFLIIQDIDLGPRSETGLDIIKNVRAKGFAGRICVHSNRFLFEDQKLAIGAGADCILPKPMGRSHLLQIILSALISATNGKKSSAEHRNKNLTKELKIAYLDDTKTFTVMWKMKLSDQVDLETFSNTSSFLEKCEEHSAYLHEFDAIVTDYHFGPEDKHSGITFAEELRKLGYTGPILLATNGDFSSEEVGPHITATIGKNVPTITQLRHFIKNET